jgi:sortase A
MVSGALLIVEAAVTVLWQEPVSAFLASRSQADLEDDFEDLRRALRAERATLRATEPKSVPTIEDLAARQATTAEIGEAVGRIEIPAIDSSFTFVEGVDRGSLRKGPGHYVQTSLPGQGGTVALAGHRTTYLAPFREIDELERGDAIRIRMPYGRFRYEVEGSAIVDPGSISVLGETDHERLVLTACHPLYSAAQRIVVFGSLQRAPGRAEG